MSPCLPVTHAVSAGPKRLKTASDAPRIVRGNAPVVERRSVRGKTRVGERISVAAIFSPTDRLQLSPTDLETPTRGTGAGFVQLDVNDIWHAGFRRPLPRGPALIILSTCLVRRFRRASRYIVIKQRAGVDLGSGSEARILIEQAAAGRSPAPVNQCCRSLRTLCLIEREQSPRHFASPATRPTRIGQRRNGGS